MLGFLGELLLAGAALAGLLLTGAAGYTLGRREGQESPEPSPEPARSQEESQPLKGVRKNDEERVIDLLEGEPTPIPQQAILEATGWSAAKVSRLTSAMEDEGTITKIPIGRENLIQLNGGSTRDSLASPPTPQQKKSS